MRRDAEAHPSLTLTLLAVAAISYVLQQTLVVPALATIQRDLNASTTWATWVFTGFLLSSAVATPLIGKLGDTYGKKRLLVVSLAVFLIGTVLAATAQSIAVLIVLITTFLAYNANNGLPWVPSKELTVEVKDAANIVPGNEVRIGGTRVGVVSGTRAKQYPDGRATALREPVEQGADAVRTVVRRGLARVADHADQLVLGADPPLLARLAGIEIPAQVLDRTDRDGIMFVDEVHAVPRTLVGDPSSVNGCTLW